ncbi:adenine phosphoribosyltransferase [bacterium]|nr:adenine phosphoribosyltransferase [bacterium]MBU1024767.1 adenine phosphoribosyltransferase [bacterium]
MDLAKFIRDVPDFPKAGIIFKDITPLLKDPDALQDAIAQLAEPYWDQGVTDVIGIESRGFIFGSALALELGVGFIPIRKPGKLPYITSREEYQLEYGNDAIELHTDALNEHSNVVICDDLLATGGTAAASVKLVQSLGARIAGISFLIELEFLSGKDKLPDVPVYTIIKF